MLFPRRTKWSCESPSICANFEVAAKTSAASWTNCYYLQYAYPVLVQLNLDIPQHRNEKSLIANTHSIFLCLLHTDCRYDTKKHTPCPEVSQHGNSVPPLIAFLVPCELIEFSFFDHFIFFVSSSPLCTQQFLRSF